MSVLISKHTVSVLVDNEPGVLARVIGLISGRGYNIDSLTVAEVDAEKHISRITIVAPGTEETVNKMISQLQRIVPVKRAVNVTFTALFTGTILCNWLIILFTVSSVPGATIVILEICFSASTSATVRLSML